MSFPAGVRCAFVTNQRFNSLAHTLVLTLSSVAVVCLCAASNLARAAEASDPAETAASDAAVAKSARQLSAPELAEQIDVQIHRALGVSGIPASPRADDAEFLRRASLDIAGVIPPLDRVEPFLNDQESDKRARLIDELLRSEEYVRHMTDQWRAFLIPSTAAAARRRHERGIQWLESAFRENRPYDEFVRGVLTADGMQRDNGATTFLLTHQSLDEVTDRLARLLLGVQITCAQCHDHPFADWKQEDYWGVAAFFSKIKHQYERIDKVEHYGVSERGDRKPLMTPPSLVVVPPTYLGGEPAALDPNEPYLPVFVDWLASEGNPYFARAFVNRTWRKLLGRGLVEPVDDLREANPGTHPELLALLGEQFRLNGFDIHYLIRAMMLSETYNRTSRSVDGNRDDTELYSHMPVRVLSPYALGDSIATVMRTGEPPAPPPPPPDPSLSPDEQLKLAQRGRFARDGFAAFFKGEDDPSPMAYEVGMPQALRLMNSQEMQRGSSIVRNLSKKSPEPAALIEQFYLATLTRWPTDEERATALDYVTSRPDASRALADIVWALVNSTEFTTNH